jgi:preprotein translocase subunit SecA
VRRLHRQLLGRAARQGDPGSGERLLCQDSGLLAERLPRWLRAATASLGRRSTLLPNRWGRLSAALAQRLEELRHQVALWRLREHSRAWRRRIDFAGPSE